MERLILTRLDIYARRALATLGRTRDPEQAAFVEQQLRNARPGEIPMVSQRSAVLAHAATEEERAWVAERLWCMSAGSEIMIPWDHRSESAERTVEAFCRTRGWRIESIRKLCVAFVPQAEYEAEVSARMR